MGEHWEKPERVGGAKALCCQVPDLRFLDAFFLAAAAAFSLAILSDATAVGTETGLALPQVTARACHSCTLEPPRGVCVVTLAQETLWELLTCWGR